jgi:hypothetical protein
MEENTRDVSGLFLYQTEAVVLAVIVSGSIIAFSFLTQSNDECFMEIYTTVFCTSVLVVTQIVFVAVSAFQRPGVSGSHKSAGHACFAVIFLALVTYAMQEIQNTICCAVLAAGFCLIFSLPVLAVAFAATPVREIPPLMFTREGMFLAGVTIATIASAKLNILPTLLDIPFSGTKLLSPITISAFFPPACVIALSTASSIIDLAATQKDNGRGIEWFNMIPQCIMTFLVAVYTILAYLEHPPFSNFNTTNKYAILTCFSISLMLCIIHTIKSAVEYSKTEEIVMGVVVPEDEPLYVGKPMETAVAPKPSTFLRMPIIDIHQTNETRNLKKSK